MTRLELSGRQMVCAHDMLGYSISFDVIEE